MIAWAAITIFFGFGFIILIEGMAYEDVKSTYPKHIYSKFEINLSEPILSRTQIIKFLFNQNTLIRFGLSIFVLTAFYWLITFGAQLLIRFLTHSHFTIVTMLRNLISVSFFIFLFFATYLVVINTYMRMVRDELDYKKKTS